MIVFYIFESNPSKVQINIPYVRLTFTSAKDKYSNIKFDLGFIHTKVAITVFYMLRIFKLLKVQIKTTVLYRFCSAWYALSARSANAIFCFDVNCFAQNFSLLWLLFDIVFFLIVPTTIISSLFVISLMYECIST